jgi:hypothetical protein
LDKKERELREAARKRADRMYLVLTSSDPGLSLDDKNLIRVEAKVLAYVETYKNHRYGRCMTYACITGRFIKSLGQDCYMATVSMNDGSDEHVFIVMGDKVNQDEDCAGFDDTTVVCDEWIAKHPKSLKMALSNVGIYRGPEYAAELKRLGYSTELKRVYPVTMRITPPTSSAASSSPSSSIV